MRRQSRTLSLRRLAHRLQWLFWILAASTLVVLALVVSLGRYYLQHIGQYQEEILAAVEGQTGLQLEVGQLSGSWRRMVPALRAGDVVLYHPETGEPVLQAGAAMIQVDLLRSLLQRTPRIRRFIVRELAVELEETSLGRWRLQGFSGDGEGDFDAVTELVLGVARARFHQAELRLRFLSGHQTTLQASELRLARTGEFRRLSGSLWLATEGEPPLELIVEARGDPRQPEQFRARGHASFRGIDLSPVLPLLEPLGVALREARVDGELWLAWHGARQFRAQGHLSMPALDLAALSGRSLQPLTDVQLEVGLEAEHRDWTLWLPTLRAHWAGEPLQLDRLWLQGNVGGDLQFWLPELELDRLGRVVARSGLLAADHADILTKLAPRGQLRRLQGRWPRGGEPELAAEFERVGLDPWNGVPGTEGAAGHVRLGPRQGTVHLASRGLRLDFPPVYDHPLTLDAAQAVVSWNWVGDEVTVQSGAIQGQGPMGRVRGQLALELPAGEALGRRAPRMTLQLGLQDSHSRYHPLLVPTLLDGELRQWLAAAIGPAEIPAAGVIYRGSLRADDEPGRSVQVWLDVRDGSLDYFPPWPALHGVEGQVVIDDGDVVAWAPRAGVQTGGRVEQAHLAFDRQSQRLSARAELRATDGEVLAALTDTPLRETVGELLDRWTWRGEAEASLGLDLALGEEEELPWVAVSARAGPGQLVMEPLPGKPLTLAQLRGNLSYRSHAGPPAEGSAALAPGASGRGRAGFHADELSARVFGQPVVARVRQRQEQVELTATLPRLAVADVRRWLELPPLVEELAQGSTSVELTLTLGDDASGLQARSSLEGVALALPRPWGKAAEEVRPLELVQPLPEGVLSLTLGEQLQGAWQASSHSAALALGPAELPRLRRGRLRVAGLLDAPEVADWQQLLARARAGQSAAEPVLEWPLRLELTDLYLSELTLSGQVFSNVRIQGGGWPGRDLRLQLRADQASGELVMPAPSGAPLALWLGRLDLTGGKLGAALPESGPTEVPELEVAVGTLYLDGELLGGLRFELAPRGEGWSVEGLGGSLWGISVTGSAGQRGAHLSWQPGAEGGFTRFGGQLLSGDLAEVLAGFGYEPALTNRRARMDVDLSWPGGPGNFHLAGLSGEGQLAIDEGRFVNVSDTASGALKAMGIFNLANLTRRLRLDFSDIFGSGISFTELRGEFDFRDGLVETRRPLRVSSPSSRFQAAGQLDFLSDQVDMELTATLPIASNLPWVAALAGGLPAAAGVFIVGKLLERQMDRYSSLVYHISGDWRDPRLEFLRVFDVGGPDSDDER